MLLVNGIRHRDPVPRLRFVWPIRRYKNSEILYICGIKPMSMIDTVYILVYDVYPYIQFENINYM